jgi:hypothetical protein
MSCHHCNYDRENTEAGACFNAHRTHRYVLWRNWEHGKPIMAVVMLNPSVANEFELDPTLRRVFRYAKAWGFGGMRILNAFSLVSTFPERLLHAELVSETNDDHIIDVVTSAHRTMVGWGTYLDKAKLVWRVPELRYMLARHAIGPVMAWRITATGQPSHPLYLPGEIEPVAYPLQATA